MTPCKLVCKYRHYSGNFLQHYNSGGLSLAFDRWDMVSISGQFKRELWLKIWQWCTSPSEYFVIPVSVTSTDVRHSHFLHYRSCVSLAPDSVIKKTLLYLCIQGAILQRPHIFTSTAVRTWILTWSWTLKYSQLTSINTAMSVITIATSHKNIRTIIYYLFSTFIKIIRRQKMQIAVRPVSIFVTV